MRGERSNDRAADAPDTCASSGTSGSSNEVESTWSRVELGLDGGQRLASVLHAERWTFASLGMHVLALFCFALMPPKSSALALDMLSEDVRYAKYLATPVALDPPTFLEDGGSDQSEGGRAPASEGAQGAPDAPRKPGHRAGAREPHMHRDVARSEARNAGILGVLTSQAGRIEIGQSAFDPAGIEPDVAAALSSLTSGAVGSSFGFHGLGMRGTGRGGGHGVDGAIGVGKLGSGLGRGGSGYCGDDKPCMGGFRGRDAKVPQVRSTGAEVHGALAKEAIRRTIQRHLNEVRFCYTEGLRTTPELAGRVQVSFLITSSGMVQEANVIETDLHQPVVERCIAEAVRRWTFPAPEGGGYVMVRYPFVFEQIGQ